MRLHWRELTPNQSRQFTCSVDGWACVLLADWPEAQRAFDTALQLDRNFAETHGALAVVQVHRGQAEVARATIERALRLDRTCLSAHYALALVGSAQDADRLRALAQRLLAAKRRGRDTDSRS